MGWGMGAVLNTQIPSPPPTVIPSGPGEQQYPERGLRVRRAEGGREARLPGAWSGAGSVLGPGLTAPNGKCFARTQNHRVRERWHWEPLSDLLQAQRSRHVSFSNGSL